MPEPREEPMSESDAKIARMEAELRKQADTLFTKAPHPGPIPEALREPPAKPPESKKLPDVAGMARAWAVALDFVFMILAGGLLGWGFDWWRGTLPWGLLGGLVFGFVVAFWRIIKATQKQEAQERAGRGRG